MAMKTCHGSSPSAVASRCTTSCSSSGTRLPFQILSARPTSRSPRPTSDSVHDAWVRANRASSSLTPRSIRSWYGPYAPYDSDVPERGASDLPPTRTDFDQPPTTSGVDSPHRSAEGSTAHHPTPADVWAPDAGHEITDKPAPGVENSAKVADGRQSSTAQTTASASRADLSNPMSASTSELAGATAPSGAEGSAPNEQVSPRGDTTNSPATESSAAASQSADQPESRIDIRESGPITLGNRADSDFGATTASESAPFVPQAVGPTDQSAPATPWTAAPGASAPRPTSGKPAVQDISSGCRPSDRTRADRPQVGHLTVVDHPPTQGDGNVHHTPHAMGADRPQIGIGSGYERNGNRFCRIEIQHACDTGASRHQRIGRRGPPTPTHIVFRA